VSSLPATLARTIHSIDEVLIARTRTARSAATAAHTRALIEPLVALVVDQGVTIRDQAETLGRLKAELETMSGEVVRAKERERRLVDELARDRAEHHPGPPEQASARPSEPPGRRWQHVAMVVAGIVAVVLLVVLLLFMVPPLDAHL
jgi:hypothetical protein